MDNRKYKVSFEIDGTMLADDVELNKGNLKLGLQ